MNYRTDFEVLSNFFDLFAVSSKELKPLKIISNQINESTCLPTPLNCLAAISEAFDYCMIFINLATIRAFAPASQAFSQTNCHSTRRKPRLPASPASPRFKPRAVISEGARL
ncbi:MAG: hypothetical protein I8H77_19115 [Comamonadaceae bacterium]|nr:hypothetical protein [Comamonadaceae bacterium]